MCFSILSFKTVKTIDEKNEKPLIYGLKVTTSVSFYKTFFFSHILLTKFSKNKQQRKIILHAYRSDAVDAKYMKISIFCHRKIKQINENSDIIQIYATFNC